MYNMGKRQHHHRRLRTAVIFVVIITGGILLSQSLLHATKPPTSTIHNAQSITTQYAPTKTAKVHITKSNLSFNLPMGWVATTTNLTPTPSFMFRSPSQQAQALEIFMDAVPTNLAVNRVVAVTAKGSQLDHNQVSDNCASFTRPSKSNPGSGIATGKWQGTDFLCDLGNYQRDVVGISSADGVNYVTLTGSTTGKHRLFITYTDNNINPDFSTLYGILESLSVT